MGSPVGSHALNAGGVEVRGLPSHLQFESVVIGKLFSGLGEWDWNTFFQDSSSE